MKYLEGIAVDGREYVEVEANDLDEARNKANDMVCEVNFGKLEDINWNAISAEDENGNFIEY